MFYGTLDAIYQVDRNDRVEIFGCPVGFGRRRDIAEDGAPIDEFLAGMSEALLKGRWTARETSELRRQELLPRAKALKWDQLMVEPRYMHALSLLP